MARKVLVVDDEKVILSLLESTLSRAGYEVTTADDGIEAMEKLREDVPDFIVLDIVMPVMDGYEMLAQLQSDPRYKDIPVIILTARAQEADMVKGWRSGVAGYITKPINVDHFVTMLKRLEQFMDNGTPPAPPLTTIL